MQDNWFRVENVAEVPSPALLIYLARVEENVRRMIDMAGGPGRLRPHIKTHKLPELARLQLEAGAVGITCQKLGEAEVMADAGVEDIRLSFPLGGEAKAERLAGLAKRGRRTECGGSGGVGGRRVSNREGLGLC